MSIYLKNATYVDWETLKFKTGIIKVNQGQNAGIEFVDAVPTAPTQGDEVVDVAGKIVTHAFACGHHHIYSGLAGGMPFPNKPMNNFVEILQHLWWNLDKKLDLDMIKASAYAVALGCAKNGVSFVIDHHASPLCIRDSLKTIADVLDEVGLSHILCVEHSDRDGEEALQNNLDETANYLEMAKTHPTYQGLVGLHASFTCGDSNLKRSMDLMEKFNSGLHIHVAEDLADESHCEQRYSKRVVERLNDFGALKSSKSIFAHCIHLNDSERAIMNAGKAYIAVNTDSNLNNRVGTFTSHGLNPDRIMLGTDGMYSNMMESAKTHYFVNHALENLQVPDAYARLRNVNRYIRENHFKGDGDNNLVILDPKMPTPLHEGNFLGHFFYGWNSSVVECMIAQGKFVLRDRQVATVNENEVLSFCRTQAERLWSKL